jgi:hypothetical protein
MGGVSMQRVLLGVSIITLLGIGVAIIGQILMVTQGITYTPSGQPTDPTPLNTIISFMAGIGGALSMPLSFVTFIFGIIVMAQRNQTRWLIATVVAGILAVCGLIGMAWILLSANSSIAFVTPLALISIVTLLYSLGDRSGKAMPQQP